MISTSNSLYENSLGIALVLMLFFAIYFIVAKTPDKRIFRNYRLSRRIMAGALLLLSANYAVHLFVAPRFSSQDSAIVMNLSTYRLAYWFFSCAMIMLLNSHYLTAKRFMRHVAGWVAYSGCSVAAMLCLPAGPLRYAGIAALAIWLFAYGIYQSRIIILHYRWAMRLFDDTHSEDIGAYIRWLSIFTWWAIIYGVGCSLLTFLPDQWVWVWILSSVPFYIYLFCSYLNYLLFYEQVENILEKEMPAATIEQPTAQTADGTSHHTTTGLPAYHAHIKEQLDKWVDANGYTRQGLTIEDLAGAIGTNRTYLSSYIKAVYHISFREWIAKLRIEYAKRLFIQHPELTVAAISEESGFISLSYFTKIFTQKEGCSPAKWRKNAATGR